MLFVNKEHILQQRAMNMRWIQNFTWSLNILIEICITISYTSKHLPTTGRLTIYTLKKINNVWTIRMCAILLHTQSHKHTHTQIHTQTNTHTHKYTRTILKIVGMECEYFFVFFYVRDDDVCLKESKLFV